MVAPTQPIEMAADVQSRGRSSVERSHTCTMTWSEDCLKRSLTFTSASHEDAVTCHRYCMTRVIAAAPASFECNFKGSGAALEAEIILSRDILDKLPLLADICNTVEASPDGQTGLVPEWHPPYCLSGLVGLLLLVE